MFRSEFWGRYLGEDSEIRRRVNGVGWGRWSGGPRDDEFRELPAEGAGSGVWGAFTEGLHSLRKSAEKQWLSLGEPERCVLSVVAVNVAVFALWRLTPLRLQYRMRQVFTHKPFSHRVYPMLTSVFSHYSLPHLGFNMLALYSFGVPYAREHGGDEFLAFFVSAGVLSSYGSLLYKVLARVSAPSIGASGAVFALFADFALANPDARLYIVLLPFWEIPALSTMYALVGVDVLGCLLGWRVLDHAAHLSGTLFGAWYHTFGHDAIWGNRDVVVRARDRVQAAYERLVK